MDGEIEQCVLFKYMEFFAHLNDGDSLTGGMRLGWSTDHAVDYTIEVHAKAGPGKL